MTKDILFIVQNSIFLNDGYRSRIEMEIDILGDQYRYFFLAPREDDNDILNFSKVYKIFYYKGCARKKPFFLEQNEFNKTLGIILEQMDQPLVICEAFQSAYLYDKYKKSKPKFLYDCHGSQSAEIYMRRRNLIGLLYSTYIKNYEKRILKDAALVITVSNNQYNQWHIDKNWCKLPMLPAEQFFDNDNYRELIRTKLKIEQGSTVFVYSGQSQKWQMAEETVKIYKEIEGNSTNSFFLILTHDIEVFNDLANRYGIKRFRIISVDHRDMPKYLDACDFGFCLRENDEVNIVSSPTKVLEYLTRNVKPILTEFVGDYSQELASKGLAIIKEKGLFPLEKIKSNNGMKYVMTEYNNYSREYSDKVRNIINENENRF